MKKSVKPKSRSKRGAGSSPKKPSGDLNARGPVKCEDLFELSHDLVQVFTPEGSVLKANPTWLQFLEYKAEDLPNLSFFNIIHPNDRNESKEVFKAVSRDKKTRKFFAILLTKRGGEICVEGTVSDAGGNERQPVLRGIFKDVTQHKRYEELNNEFVSTVSHELRTPLTDVREGIAQLRDGLSGKIPADQKALFGRVLQNVDLLGRIIGELLDIFRLESGQAQIQRKTCNIVDLVREVVQNFQPVAKQKNLEVSVDFEKEKIEVSIDRDKIAQVFANLISNSLKFTARGQIRVQLRDTEDFVECKVSDTGKGISEEDLPAAFDKFRPFERTIVPGDKGTGPGLSICKRLVELHHGRVMIESAVGKGTTVSFLLPKYTHRDLFREAIAHMMNQCAEEGTRLSVIIFDIMDFDLLKKTFGEKGAAQIVVQMEEIINHSLRRAADIAIKDSRSILVLLPDTKKENALIALARLRQILEYYLLKEQKTSKIEIRTSVACFPEDADTIEKLIDKIHD